MAQELTCDPVAIDARFAPSSHAWSARDVITAVETARAKLIKPVPFYIYDAPILPTSIEAELDAMKACGAAAKNYHYGGEYWFLKQLQNHRWRVSNPDDAPPKAETRMRHLLLHFGKDLLWRHPQSRVAENFLITARRWRKRENPLTECCPMRDEVALEVKDYKT